ncbi:hypothetical protein Tco_0457702, partial [Tanacetum coccineum]
MFICVTWKDIEMGDGLKELAVSDRDKILDWLDGFQKLPYVSPGRGFCDCLRKYLRLPQKVHKAFEPHESKVILRNRRLRNQFVCSGDTHDG